MSRQSAAERESVILFVDAKRGSEVAAQDIHDRYVHRLIGLARHFLDQRIATRVDPEDVVQSVYRSFFRATKEGRIVIREAGDLWRVLAGIARNKARRANRHHRQGKRAVALESSWAGSLVDRRAGDDPAAALELIEEMFAALTDFSPVQRGIVELLLQGYTTAEVARQTDRTERTVRRVHQRLRESLCRRLDGGEHGAAG